MAFLIDWAKSTADWLAGKKRKIVIPDQALLKDEHLFWQEQRPPTTWTWPLVSAMVTQLENAQFTLAAQLCDSLGRDWACKGLVDTRKKAVTKLHTYSDPEDEELNEEFPRIFPKSTQGEVVFWTVFLGFCVGQLVWDMDQQRPTVRPVHPSQVRWRQDLKKWQVLTKDGLITLEGENAPGAGKWVVYKAEDTDRPWMDGLIRAVGLLMVIHQATWVDWAKHSRTHGSATRVLTVPALSGEIEDVQKALEGLKKLNNGSVIHLLEGMNIQLLEPKTASWQVFDKLHDAAERALAILILGQTQTTDGGQAGSLAKARVHNEVRWDRVQADAELLQGPTHDQVLVPYFAYRRSIGDWKLVPKVIWDATPPENAAQKAEVAKSTATAWNQGASALKTLVKDVEAPVDIEAALRRLGVPVEGDDPSGRPQGTMRAGRAACRFCEGRKTVLVLSNADAPLESATARRCPKCKGTGYGAGSASAPSQARLVSGDDPAQASGLIAGQQYADGLAADTVGIPGLQALVAAVQAATSHEDLRSRLVGAYGEMDPARLEKRLRQAMVLAELAGRLAVVQDTGAGADDEAAA